MASGDIIGKGRPKTEEEYDKAGMSLGFQDSGFQGLSVRPGGDTVADATAAMESAGTLPSPDVQRSMPVAQLSGRAADIEKARRAKIMGMVGADARETLGTAGYGVAGQMQDKVSLGQQAVNRLDSRALGAGPVNVKGQQSIIGQDVANLKRSIARGKDVKDQLPDLSGFEKDFDARAALEEGLVTGADRRKLFESLRSKDSGTQRQAQKILNRINSERKKQYRDKKKQEAIDEAWAQRKQEEDFKTQQETIRYMNKKSIDADFQEKEDEKKWVADQYNKAAEVSRGLAEEERGFEEWKKQQKYLGRDPDSRKAAAAAEKEDEMARMDEQSRLSMLRGQMREEAEDDEELRIQYEKDRKSERADYQSEIDRNKSAEQNIDLGERLAEARERRDAEDRELYRRKVGRELKTTPSLKDEDVQKVLESKDPEWISGEYDKVMNFFMEKESRMTPSEKIFAKRYLKLLEDNLR